MSIIDEYTRYAEIIVIYSRAEVPGQIRKCLVLWETQSGMVTKEFRSDKAGEYQAAELGEFFTQKGILHLFSAPYAHEQMSIAEIFNRTILGKVRAILF